MTTTTAPYKGYEITPEIDHAWDVLLSDAARGLDLTDPEDRAFFRFQVQRAAQRLHRDYIVALARHFGATLPGNVSHAAAARALVDAWIAS